jgi:hypothetical protein
MFGKRLSGIARQRLSKKIYRCNEHTSNNKRIVELIFFRSIGVVSRKAGDYLFPEFDVCFGAAV